jgi:hypothetical protein
VPVTVKVYAPAVVPLLPDEPHPASPDATTNAMATIRDACHLRRLFGSPRNTSNANTAPPPPNLQGLPPMSATPDALLAEVELTVIVAVPVVVVELRLTEPLLVHVGTAVAPLGDEVSAQARLTDPLYAFDVDTVTVEVATVPGATAAGFVADKVNTEVATVTEVVPVPVA